MDARLSWAKAGLIVTACAVGGFGLSYLIVAMVLDRALNSR